MIAGKGGAGRQGGRRGGTSERVRNTALTPLILHLLCSGGCDERETVRDQEEEGSLALPPRLNPAQPSPAKALLKGGRSGVGYVREGEREVTFTVWCSGVLVSGGMSC